MGGGSVGAIVAKCWVIIYISESNQFLFRRKGVKGIFFNPITEAETVNSFLIVLKFTLSMLVDLTQLMNFKNSRAEVLKFTLLMLVDLTQ